MKNRPLYERVFGAQRTLMPDRLSREPKQAAFETFTDKHVLTDGTRTIELHHIKDHPHNQGIVMAYLPKERILVEADVFNPPAAGATLPANRIAYAQNLQDNLQRLKLP